MRDGANWYVYVNNNPLNMIDPTGLKGGRTSTSFMRRTFKEEAAAREPITTLYFGPSAKISLPFADLFNPDMPTENNSSFGLYFDFKDMSFGGYVVNSPGKSIMADAQLGFEVGASQLGADDLFSRSTATMEASAMISESVVQDVETGEIVATESAFSWSALGKFFGSKYGQAAETFFNFDLAGRQDYTSHVEFFDFTKDEVEVQSGDND